MPRFAEIVKAPKAMTIKRILDNKNSKESMLALKLMGFTHRDLLCKYSSLNIKTHTLFYTQALHSWYELFSVESTPTYIGEEFIWKNRFLTYDGKPFEPSDCRFSGLHNAGFT